MFNQGQLVKARIVKKDNEYECVECMFNPKELKFVKSNKWTHPESEHNKNSPDLQFSRGEGMTLTMDLFFDTYEQKTDVRDCTKEVWKFMWVDKEQAEPPHCIFRWGLTVSFEAVITDITETFTLFLDDGRPVRSTLNVTFKQTTEENKYPGQNPTTLSMAGYRTALVKQGETLDWIAHREYGDCKYWRFLAEVNHLDNPMKIRDGQCLAIAPVK